MNKDAIATEIIGNILNNISDRKGIGDELDQIDDDIKQEMIDEWTVIILNALDR